MAFVIFMGPWKTHIIGYVCIQMTQHVVFVQCSPSTCWFSKWSHKMNRCFASKLLPQKRMDRCDEETNCCWQQFKYKQTTGCLNNSVCWDKVHTWCSTHGGTRCKHKKYRKYFFMDFSISEHTGSLFSLNPQKRLVFYTQHLKHCESSQKSTAGAANALLYCAACV